jgi:hypothetical protein
MIESRRIRWARHIVCMKDEKYLQNFWLENLKGRDYLEDLGIDGRTLYWMLGK